jgi:hypothetical protein
MFIALCRHSSWPYYRHFHVRVIRVTSWIAFLDRNRRSTKSLELTRMKPKGNLSFYTVRSPRLDYDARIRLRFWICGAVQAAEQAQVSRTLRLC